MIIYGSKTVHLDSVRLDTITCESCRTQGSIVLNVFRKHAHIFWIPLFPIGKRGLSECDHCKNVLEAKDMQEPLKSEYHRFKNNTKGPIWQFAGLAIIAVLIVWGNYASGQNEKLELEYIVSPMEGDIYEYKIEARSYSTLKVMSVSNDSVFVSPNEYEISKMSKIHKIDKLENYPEFSYGISRVKLKEMYDSGDIIGINR